MKKIYQIPEIEVTDMMVESLNCESPKAKSDGYSSERESLSRRNSYWDDEEE